MNIKSGVIILIFSTSIFYSYSGEKPKPHVKQKGNKTDFLQNDHCKTTLWKQVYNPSRLEIIDSCITVTGIIEASKSEDDGDQHLLLKLDAGQEDLLNKRNLKKKMDNLVLEVVCANKTKDKKAKKACKGYINNIQLQPIGTHVKITGSYVIDSNNGWAEIHPVMKMEEIK